MTLSTMRERKEQRRDFVAKALYVGNSTNAEPMKDWDDFLKEPDKFASTLAWYRKQADFAITAMQLFTHNEDQS